MSSLYLEVIIKYKQLRDKLTVLPPLIFNEVPRNIASGPELPVLNELDVRQNLSKTLPKTKRCGVPLKYHCDSEAQKKDHSTNPDESITNDIFEKLYMRNPNFNLADYLVMDCGNIPGEETEDSDFIEIKPVEKKVRHKKLSTKRNVFVQDEPAIDESEVVVIDDTIWYVYDRKEMVRANNTKADKMINEEIVTSDETTIDALFSKDVNQNNTEYIITPTLAKQIKETSLEASNEALTSGKDTSYEHNTKGTKKVTLKSKQSKKIAPKMNTRKKAAKNDKDPIDIGTSNVLVESTSYPLNSIKAILTRKKRKLYSPKDDENENKEITTAKTRVERRQSYVNETPIATCYRELENARQSHSRISKKSRASIEAKKSKKFRYNMSSESDGEDPSFQIRKRTKTSSSSIGSRITMSRRGRPVTPNKYIHYHYTTIDSSSGDGDFERNRTIKPKTARKIKPRSRKVEKTSRNMLILSPKTKNINEMFDKIKNNVVNDEKTTIVGKKSVEKDLYLYNLSSGSKDGDHKKKQNQVQKRISSTSFESSATKRRTLMNRVNTGHLLLNAHDNDDGVLEPTEIIETALLSDVLSERSIATGGRSPIIRHNDLNESASNIELLDEVFQHRDMHNEMSESMAEFLTSMRNQLQTNKPTVSQPSCVIPYTRMSKAKIVLERLSSDEINRYLKKNQKHKSIPKSIPKAQTSKNDLSFIKIMTRSKPDKAPASMDRCDVNRSIASVQDWFKRKATPNSPSAADKNAMKETLGQVMDTFQTTLAEIHHATDERLAAAFVKNHEEITYLRKKVQEITLAAIRIEEKLVQFGESQKERVCEVIRADSENKARMVKLLQEDIQSLLN